MKRPSAEAWDAACRAVETALTRGEKVYLYALHTAVELVRTDPWQDWAQRGASPMVCAFAARKFGVTWGAETVGAGLTALGDLLIHCDVVWVGAETLVAVDMVEELRVEIYSDARAGEEAWEGVRLATGLALFAPEKLRVRVRFFNAAAMDWEPSDCGEVLGAQEWEEAVEGLPLEVFLDSENGAAHQIVVTW